MTTLRHDWKIEEISHFYNTPFIELMYQAHCVHRKNFNPNAVQISTLLSIKTGSCPEDCGYCTQSGHYNTALQKEKLLSLETVVQAATAAKKNGATRFCMGAAWRHPPKKDLPRVTEMIKKVKELNLETCVTLGMLETEDVEQLEEAGLDFYNHNLDTSPEYYKNVTSTRTYQDRLSTLNKIRDSKIKVCCGGIIGMGESREDRISLLQQLANMPSHPLSVPINQLAPIPGTPLGNSPPLDAFEFIRTIAIAKILMPKSFIRLSAGRDKMSEEMQAWCFFAGANSIHYGEKLLTVGNPHLLQDKILFAKLGLKSLEMPRISSCG